MKFVKNLHWFEVLLITVVMSLHLYAAFSAPHNFPSRWFTRDDAYYYFKVAQNISEGHGSSFDGINLTNGYHPLWMLICIPIFSLARLDLILPLRILLVVMALISSVTSILLFRLLKKHTGSIAAMLAASYWALDLEIHSIITQQGMETGIVALSIVLFLYNLQTLEQKPKASTWDLVKLGLMGLLVLFSRLDGIYFVLIAGVWVILRHSPARYLLSIDLLLTYGLFVLAFIQRASLKVYLLAFDSSAIAMATIAFVIQTIIFYFSGLYTRPANLTPVRLVINIAVGVTISALLSTPIMLGVSALSELSLPRAVPAIYWVGMLGLTLLTRLSLRKISPWPATLSRELKPYGGFLAGKNHIRVAMEPLTRWFQKGLIYFGILGTGLATYMGLNLAIFGTIMPVSGQIKRWWGSMPNDVYGGGAKSILDVFGIDPNYSQSWSLLTNPLFRLSNYLKTYLGNEDGWFWIMVFFLCISTVWIISSNRKKYFRSIFQLGLIPLAISAILHAFFYGAMSYAAKHEWYWVMQMLTLVIAGALIAGAFLDHFRRSGWVQSFARVFVALCFLILTYRFGAEIIQRMPYQDALAGQPYMDTLPILEGFTEPGALIGMTGGGNTGYFIKDRTIVNMDGLINSFTYFQNLKNNQGGKYLSETGMQYIFANPYIITSSMPYRYQFSETELSPVNGAPSYGQKELLKYTPTK